MYMPILKFNVTIYNGIHLCKRGRVKAIGETQQQKMALSMEDLATILRELYEARSKWMDLGVQLELDVSELESIREKYSDNPDKCFREMFISWLKSSSKVPKTWKTLVDVLKQPAIGYGVLGEKIKANFGDHDPQKMTTGKRQRQTTEVHVATKRPHLEDGYPNETFEDLKMQLLEKEKLIGQLTEQYREVQGERQQLKKLVEDRDNEILKLKHNDVGKLNQRYAQLQRETKQTVDRLQSQLQHNSTQIQNLQNEIGKKEMEIENLKKETPSAQQPKPPQVVNRCDVRVSSNDINIIRKELHSVRDCWHDIGLELNINLSTLDHLKTKHGGDSKECLLRMISEWFRWMTRPHTWGEIIDALRSPIIEQHELAATLEAKYCVKS